MITRKMCLEFEFCSLHFIYS